MTEPVIPEGTDPQPAAPEPAPARVVIEPRVTGSTEGEGGEPPAAVAPESATPEPAPEPAVPPVAAAPTWATQRISRLTEERRQAQTDLQTAQAEIARLTGGGAGVPPHPGAPGLPAGMTQAQLDAAVTERAAAIQFNRECDKVYAQGATQFPDWDASLKNFGLLGGLTPQFLEAAMEQDEPQRVLHALSKDPDTASRLLQMSGTRLGAAMAKFALKSTPATAVKPPAGETIIPPVAKPTPSAAPDPIVPRVGGSNPTRAVRLDDDAVDMKDWVKARNAQLKQRA